MSRRKTLRAKTFGVLFVLSLVVMIAATVAATAASYSTYEREEEQMLLSQALVHAEHISDLDQDRMVEELATLPNAGVRCTLIAADGTVLFDNEADASTLNNHALREEVAIAKEAGQAVVMRRSETFGTVTLYVAAPVREDIVLRYADTRASLPSFLSGIAWQLAVSLIAIFMLSFVISRVLTKMIVRPLEDIDLSNPLQNEAYEELQPLLARVDEQRLELERQNESLEQAVEMRREFTGNVSHEMKTPLQVIGGYAELMESGMVSEEDIPRFAGLIRSESEAMRALIDDVLTLSKLDEHALGESDVIVSLAETSKRVANRLKAASEENGGRIELKFDESVYIKGDAGLVEQMVYNLVDNAIKYNKPSGIVEVAVCHQDGNALLTVADEGPGVPSDQRSRVFERFYRTDASRSRETGGTGLGLAIVKHAAESLGGSVQVEEAVSGGALFVVSIPEAQLDESWNPQQLDMVSKSEELMNSK